MVICYCSFTNVSEAERQRSHILLIQVIYHLAGQFLFVCLNKQNNVYSFIYAVKNCSLDKLKDKSQ